MNSWASLLVLMSGVLIFVGACYLVFHKRRPAVLSAYLVLLPLPVMISLCDWMFGMYRSFSAIAAMPNLPVTTAEVAAAMADSLLGLLFAILVSAPTYVVLAIGLLLRTLRSTDSPSPAALRPERPVPVPSLAGPTPATR